MYIIPLETAKFINELTPQIEITGADVIVAIPFVCIPTVIEVAKDTNIKVAVQNMY